MQPHSNSNQEAALARFALGQTVIIPGAEEALRLAGQTATQFLRRHMSGDWGELSDDDMKENELSLEQGFRLLSRYQTMKAGEAMSIHHLSFTEWWQRIACLCNIRANLTLDGREYAKYGAAPDVQILVIDKTGPTPGTSWQEQLRHISWGSVANLEEAWEVLKHVVGPTRTWLGPRVREEAYVNR